MAIVEAVGENGVEEIVGDDYDAAEWAKVDHKVWHNQELWATEYQDGSWYVYLQYEGEDIQELAGPIHVPNIDDFLSKTWDALKTHESPVTFPADNFTGN